MILTFQTFTKNETNFGIYNLAQRMVVASAPFYRP